MGETIEESFEMLRFAGDTALMKGSYRRVKGTGYGDDHNSLSFFVRQLCLLHVNGFSIVFMFRTL